MNEERLSLRQVMRAFAPFLRSSVGLLALCILSLVLATAMEVALPYLVGRATDAVALHQALGELARFCGFFLAAALARWALEGAHSWGLQRAGQRFTAELREAIYDRALRQPVRYHDETASGKIATRVLYDVRALGEVFSAAVSVLALDVFVILASVVAMLTYNWRLALGCLVPFPFLLLSLRYFGPRLGVAYRDARTRLSNLNGFLGEHLGALPTIQQLAAEENRDKRLAEYAADYEKAQRSAVHLFSLIQPCTNVVNGISTAAVLCIGGYEVLQGRATPGVVVAFLAYQKNLFQPIRDLVEKYNVFLAARVAAERVIGLLHAPEEGTTSRPASILLSEEAAPKFAAAPEVVFEGISFGYGEQTNVLHDVTFRVQPGNAVAVVGPTGSGKSSLLRLLLRFYEPRAGRILLDGHDVARLRLERLRTACAYVSQEVYLFRGTLRENLQLVAPEQPDAILREVCERVRLWPLLQGRGGLDFSIAEGGANLSAGERQLVAFARVLLRDAPLLLFDEATANLDGALERTVSEVAWELFRDRTAVVIAHRLETVLRCPQLVFFEAGRVADAGVPAELLAGNGPFAQWLATRERATASARA